MFKIQPGDIINIHAKGFNLLRLITGLYWNHTLLVDEPMEGGDYGCLESIDKGVAPTLLSNYIGQEICIMRYKGITPQQQQLVRKMARTMGSYHYDFLIVFRILRRVGIRKGIKLIIQFLNKEYPLQIPRIDDSFIVCSEFVQSAYSKAGLPLGDDRYLLTPDGIYHSDKIEVVCEGIYQ